MQHYEPFWQSGVPVDIVNEDCDFAKYRLLVAPMLYMLRPGVAERIEKFVSNGGTFIATYLTGIADETDLCFLTGWPGPLRKALGVWAEEIDALYDNESVIVKAKPDNSAGLSGKYKAAIFCDLIHAESAQVQATYGSQFYAGRPAVTLNQFGKGKAYYIASRNDRRFASDFMKHQIKELGLKRVLNTELPEGVTAQMRTDGEKEFVFIINFNREPCTVSLGENKFKRIDIDEQPGKTLRLDGYGSAILLRNL
jgi:beta-galactosidase